MSEIEIEVFQANRGDCLLVSCIGEKKTNVLIDMGVCSTYVDCVRGKLEELGRQGEEIDVLVLTHVDDDHIGGVTPFLKDNGPNEVPNKIHVRDIWFNSYRHLLHEREEGVNNQRIQRQIVRQIYTPDNVGETDISAEDGTTVAGLLYSYSYPWNKAYEGRTVKADNNPVLINNEVKITVLTPTNEQISNLQEVWLEELKEMFPEIVLNNDEIIDDAVLYASRFLEDEYSTNDSEPISKTSIELNEGKFKEDTSVINASSITFLLEFKEKRLLFLADSPPTEVLLQLKTLFPEMSPSCPVHFDVIKVSHHGSKRSTSANLMHHIYADKYIFSTCGTYGHPHIETISRILLNSPSTITKELHFNYETKISSGLNNEKWMNKYKYSCIVNEPIKIIIAGNKPLGDN